MGNKIWYYDVYGLRKFHNTSVRGFVDIGANNGSVSLMARMLMPQTGVFAFEPCKESCDLIRKNVLCWGRNLISVFNVALGDGSPLYIQGRKKESGHSIQSGETKFFTEKEKDELGVETDYSVRSRTLTQILLDTKWIRKDDQYIIKIDCEGGERFILKEGEPALNIIKKSLQTSMELHLGMGGSAEEWRDFFGEILKTHKMRIGRFNISRKNDERQRNLNQEWLSEPVSDFKETRGRPHIELIRKDMFDYCMFREKTIGRNREII